MLPKDFAPFTTVQGYFYDWRDDGLFEKINFELLLQAREAAGRGVTMRPRRSKGESAIL
jgi:putative transposase